MDGPTDLGQAHLRVARPTDDHDGFEGVMLGSKRATYHLEFTRKAGHKADRAPTEDNLLVFYMPDEAAWQAAVGWLERAGHKPVKAFNPYWDKKGKTFEDPDGYRIVLQNTNWFA